jgi:hypothetical protein
MATIRTNGIFSVAIAAFSGLSSHKFPKGARIQLQKIQLMSEPGHLSQEKSAVERITV